MTSVVVPAHNEVAVLGRLLDALLVDADPGEFEVVVVANGCTDGTAELARGYGEPVSVIELPEGSKRLALDAGDAAARSFPRLYVDGDVVLDTAGARALVRALAGAEPRAVAPERIMALDRSNRLVRGYYRVWSELPVVRTGLFGRGVLGVNEAGFALIGTRPAVMGDDLYLDSRFAPDQRAIVGQATVIVHAPRTTQDLIRRRTRAAAGNTEMARLTAGRTDSGSASGRSLLRLARRRPALWPSLPAFVAVTLLSRRRARALAASGQSGVWLRDESSRT